MLTNATYVVTLPSLQLFLWVLLLRFIHVGRSSRIFARRLLLLRPLLLAQVSLFLVAVAFSIDGPNHDAVPTY